MGGERANLRPIDLARGAGISTQQVRNLLDEGVLPPAARSAAGHRRFEERHRLALVVYHALAEGFGQRVARSILQAVHAEDLARALALVDAAHAALHEERLALSATGEALTAVAEEPAAAPSARSDLRIGDVAALVGVRTSALRVWEAAGLLAPRRERGTGYRRFGPADVRDARVVVALRRAGYPLDQIAPVLAGLRRSGSADALHAAVASRQAELTRQAFAMLDGAGRLHRYVTRGESD